MKLVHACAAAVVLGAAVPTASCGGSYIDPLDGREKQWQSSDAPSPEEARCSFAELERQKDRVDELLATLRAGPQTPTVLSNITLCVDHLELIAEGKAKLTAQRR